ncbi:hypothetical protein [Argonema antarcticum]|uniref:hypothetical protein n=1 Tax=Argonema antarcticum TaxID=2942763 RepID=UPI00201277A2|nr:hypothetical protein [Argonema antarcticum]MCL1470119.1 hypothetical protein [Argonema antarcticum A004/B2]
MKQPELTEKQLAILEHIQEIVTVGEQKLKEFMQESAKVEEKWRLRAEAKRDAAAQKLEV